MIVWYDHDLFFSTRKPRWIPSTFGTHESWLDKLITEHGSQIHELQQAYYDINYHQVNDQNSLLVWEKQGRELGLINRLDNDTSWLLFFAKNPSIYLEYKRAQEQWRVTKIYYADLYGHVPHSLQVDTPIYHHAWDQTKMTINANHGRWRPHEVTTHLEPLDYDSHTKTSFCRITITKGIRHQIRVHTSSIGYHIIGDTLYCPALFRAHYSAYPWIHLRSMGLHIHDAPTSTTISKS